MLSMYLTCCTFLLRFFPCVIKATIHPYLLHRFSHTSTACKQTNKQTNKVGPTAWTIDVGENFAGWCQYRFRHPPPAGTVLTFMHGERCNPNGTITRDIQPMVMGVDEITSYTFGSSVPAVFEPRFVSYVCSSTVFSSK